MHFDSGRCCQCGVCIASCPVSSLSSLWNEHAGVYEIVVDSVTCTGCGLCAAICPAGQLPHAEINEEQVRRAQGLFVGYAGDDRVRVMGSTGGVGRTIIHDALAAEEYDAVYSLYSAESTVEEAQGQFLTAPPAFEDIPTSLYRPILWGKNLSAASPDWKRILLVGLPCQIKGAKKLLNKKYKKLEIHAVALICRQQKTARYTDYVKMILGKPDVSYEQVTYRGYGWPGRLGIKGDARPFPGFLASARAFGQNLWRVPGCRYCSDCLGAAVCDVTLADPWNYIAEEKDPKGSNILMIWTESGIHLIKQCRNVRVVETVSSQIVEKILAFGIIYKKISEIQCRLGKQKNIIKIIAFRLREIKIRWLENVFLGGRHDSAVVKAVCRLFK